MELAFCYPVPEAYRYSQKLGCRKGYLDICWPRIQPEPGVYDFSYYDPVIAEAKAAGLELIGMVSSRRSTFPDGHWIWHNHRGMMPDPGTWGEFLEVVASRYKETIRYWEVWSEPNCLACNPMCYYDYELYLEVLKLASSRIRTADPTAKIMLGGLWFNTTTYNFSKALLTPQNVELFDIFSFHFFLMTPLHATVGFDSWHEPLTRWIEYFRSKLPQGYPIWMGEFGLPTKRGERDELRSSTVGRVVGLSEQAQAEWFAQFAEAADKEWDLGTVVWVCLQDEATENGTFNENLGLMRADGSAKPVQALIEQFQRNKAAQWAAGQERK